MALGEWLVARLQAGLPLEGRWWVVVGGAVAAGEWLVARLVGGARNRAVAVGRGRGAGLVALLPVLLLCCRVGVRHRNGSTAIY